MILIVDNYDSFTYNLVDYFHQLGQSTAILKNDELNEKSISDINFNGIVISPGPNTPSESGDLIAFIEKYHSRYPILGICLGHQALGQFFGAQLRHALKPMHGKVSEISTVKTGIYENLPEKFTVCRYHSLILEELNKTELELTAYTIEKECMSFQHKKWPITGIQYHPEAILTQYGLELLKNWLEINALLVS
ncbi:MAG: aminodeoxychorismate/anthranilate synthase component II [Bacteroidia bacterium]